MGWRYTEFWPAAHHVHDAEKSSLWLFIPALQHFGRLAELELQDKNRRWAEKMAKWEGGVAAGDSAYAPEHRFDGALRLIFPELSALIPDPEPDFDEDDSPPF